MSLIDVRIEAGRTTFEPGESVTGSASWDLPGPPTSVDVCLLWTVKGGGTQKSGAAVRVAIDAPQSRDRRTFELPAPDGPYSYAGRLLSIVWSVEVQAEPGGRSGRAELVIAPGGQPLQPPR